jgi:hypothetical protein
MFTHLSDPALPSLGSLARADLARITGAPQARLLRARYQPGARAVLHVALGPQDGAAEGAIWFFAGEKAQKLARQMPDAILDQYTHGLFQAFPKDHRLPMLATFVDGAMDLAGRLIGGSAAGPPELMRYRPGLSATFRWKRQDGRIFFVKQTPGDDVRAQALAVSHLRDALRGHGLAVVPVTGTVPGLGLIAYETAHGQPLDCLLQDVGDSATKIAMTQVIGALRVLWSLSLVPSRVLDRADLLRRAAQACTMINLLDPDAGDVALGLVKRLEATRAAVRLRPIHGDMKLEHAFLDGPMTTLIDMESLSLGDPDYDLAKLDARVTMAEVTGQITPAQASTAIAEVRRNVGTDYEWFLTCARLQCAKFFAQRLDPATVPMMRRVLAL